MYGHVIPSSSRLMQKNILQEKNAIFSDSRREKDLRGAMKAEVVRLLNKDDVTIFDAGNYIKGYR